jgi:fumarylpyruvate hydrolase
MNFTHSPYATIAIPVLNSKAAFPIHRIYCVGRNYEEHAKEMGYTGREAPFFFLKPTDSLIYVPNGSTGELPYPSLTQNFHHEIELVVAIGVGGKHIKAQEAENHIFGYGVGLDMTRRDLQNDMKKQGRPWDIGKSFDHSAPMGPITEKQFVKNLEQARIFLSVNGQDRQNSHINKLIWNIHETIEHLSSAWELKAGDLIFTGTPAGVAAVNRGQTLTGRIAGLGDLVVTLR